MTEYRRRFIDRIDDRDPNVMWIERGEGYVVQRNGGYVAVGGRLEVERGADILFQTCILAFGQRVERGQIVRAITLAWSFLRKEVLDYPSMIENFPLHSRKFEEFVAGGYRASHWSDVVLTPRSHDGGFDVAATKRGRHVLDEAKAFKPSLQVNHSIVMAVLGLFIRYPDQRIDQVRVTTTSSFAPLILREFTRLIPSKLALRDRRELLGWLRSIGSQSNKTAVKP
jgi:hypothetical protein